MAKIEMAYAKQGHRCKKVFVYDVQFEMECLGCPIQSLAP